MKNVSSAKPDVSIGVVESGINKEGANRFGNRDVGESLGPWAVETSGRPVCWVELARDVLSVDFKASREGANKLMDALETFVGFSVAVATILPPFDDSCVISVENEAFISERDRGDSVHE